MGTLLLSRRSWSVHLVRGRPGGRLHEGFWGLPTDSSTWRSMVLCAGVLSDSLTLATCPNSEYDIATSIERDDHLCQLYDYADCIRLLLTRVSY